ncbi:MAG: hypothetical protein ACD_39C01857G0001, partial [uncultured bacterium]
MKKFRLPLVLTILAMVAGAFLTGCG